MVGSDRRPQGGPDPRLRLTSYVASSVESTPPALTLGDPEPVVARRATRVLLEAAWLSPDAAEGFIGAVSEVVTNSLIHGRPPVQMLGWVRRGEAVVTVCDAGEGPLDPEAGAQPAPRDPGQGGFGLWLAHQSCSEVTMGRHTDGFTVRLVARS